MTKRILSVGECMVEVAPAAHDGLFQMAFAGDTLNTAWYLHRLQPSWQINYMTGVGRDSVSENMLGFFEKSGLGISKIVRSDSRTVGLYMIELADGERSFSYWRSVSAARLLAENPDVLKAAFEDQEMIYFSAITLGILDGDGLENLLAALKIARASGAQIVFDPNLRPKLWPSIDAMCAAVTKAAETSDVVLPSHDDEATFFGDADPQATRDRYLKAGASTVVVKNGGGEILFSHVGSSGSVSPEPVGKIVDTTAAGDSFNAGFLAAFECAKIEDAIKAGCTLAGKVIGGRGALVDV